MSGSGSSNTGKTPRPTRISTDMGFLRAKVTTAVTVGKLRTYPSVGWGMVETEYNLIIAAELEADASLDINGPWKVMLRMSRRRVQGASRLECLHLPRLRGYLEQLN